MPSLRQILAAHPPLLLLDAASAQVQVGVFDSPEVGTGGPPVRVRWATSSEESGLALFRCLTELEVDLAKIRAFAFCEGPGSMLGIRTVAMALRTWCALAPRPIFAYRSLALVAQLQADPTVGIIADARRDSWHYGTKNGPLRRVPTAELAGTLVMPEGFRHWTPLPPGVTSASYRLADLWPAALDADLLHATATPDAFRHEEPQYVTWTPQIHRAP